MRKLTLISVFLLFLQPYIFTSCEKEKPLNEAIIGRWEVESVRQVNYEDNVKVSELILYLKAGEMEIQFAEGGTGILYENGAISGLFTWTIDGNTLKLSGDTNTIEWTVTINDNVLIWSYTESEVIDNITHKYEFYYSARKVS